MYRTKIKDIVTEFAVPKNIKSSKVLIICSGMPGYPHKAKYEKIIKNFTSRGYYVFIPRYRGTWESEGVLFEKCPCFDVADVIEGIQSEFKELWSGEKFIVQNPKVFLYGTSFGSPAVLLNSKKKEVKKVLAVSPVLDWRTMSETVEPIPKLAKFLPEAFGFGYRIAKDGWKKIEEGRFYNPSFDLSKIDSKKVLLIHAKDDEVISFSSVLEFIKNTKVKNIIAKTGGHGLNIFSVSFKRAVLKFLS